MLAGCPTGAPMDFTSNKGVPVPTSSFCSESNSWMSSDGMMCEDLGFMEAKSKSFVRSVRLIAPAEMVYERARRLRSPPMIAWCSSTSRPTLFARDLPIRAWSPLSKSCRYTHPGPVGRMGCSHRHHAIWNPPSWSLFGFTSTFLLCRCGPFQPTTTDGPA